jgi:hypothetical protein
MVNDIFTFTIFSFSAILAQLVEQLIRNEQVAGSNPADGSHPQIRYPFNNLL